MIRIELAQRVYLPRRGWAVMPEERVEVIRAIRADKIDVFEEYVTDDYNILFVLFDNEAAAALFKLTYL